MLNRIILIGNLTRDPELKYSPSGLPIASFGLAVNRTKKNAQGEREVDFFNIVTFDKRAEFVSQYASKGKKLAVEGRLQTRNWVGQDGVKKSAVEIIADNVELLNSSRDSGAAPSGPAPVSSTPPPSDDDFIDPFAEA